MAHWRKMDHIAGSLLGILIVSCNYGEHSPAGSNNTAIDPAANNTPFKNTSVLVTDTIFAGNMDTAVIFKEGEVWIAGRIIANKKQPKYAVSGEKGQTVTATIKAVRKGGNVRINQIQQPGGGFDGPFGDSLSYTFKEKGSLQFIIGENSMAGDPYTGDFIFHLQLK